MKYSIIKSILVWRFQIYFRVEVSYLYILVWSFQVYSRVEVLIITLIAGWYLTTSSITLKRARRKGKGNRVTVPGPSFVHPDSTMDTYIDFFTEVKKNIRKSTGHQPEILFCSDAEAAIRSAAKDVFDKGKFFYCAKHLKENIREDLKSCKPGVRNKIMEQIFGHHGWGDDGLTSATDPNDFQRRLLDIDRTAFPPGKFDKHIKKIEANMLFRLESNGAIEANLTSNPVEAMNRLYKFYADFSLEKLPELIDHLSDIAKFYKMELMNAFIGRGDITIIGPLGQKCYVRPDLWELKSQDAREAVFNTFVTGMQSRSTTITSTNLDYEMDDVGGVRQKLSHRKRPTRQQTRPKRPTKGTKRKTPVDEEED